MAEIRSVLFLRHLRSEPSFHVLRYHKGALAAGGRGLTFWFLPMHTSVAEIPTGDRELPFLFHGRSRDFQDVTVQGSVSYRVTDPLALSERVDFSIDLESGLHLRDPLAQLTSLFTGAAQQLAARYLGEFLVQDLLTGALSAIQAQIQAGLVGSEALQTLGLEAVAVQVSAVSPTAELERALQTPAREQIQQEADRATFERRALAVERERAISENELQNQIELARRQRTLIEQEGENERRRAEEEAQAREIAARARAARKKIEAQSRAERRGMDAQAQAGWVQTVEGAREEVQQTHWATLSEVPPAVLMGLAAKELAGKLQNIEHLNLSPDLLGASLQGLLDAGRDRLKEG